MVELQKERSKTQVINHTSPATRLTYNFYSSPYGEMLVAETDRGICQLEFVDSRREAARALKADWNGFKVIRQEGKWARRACRFIRENKPAASGIPLDVRGTPFQLKVWQALLDIPFGRTASYSQVAQSIQRPTATRAVASAIARNPVSCLIPCHRVIRQNGVIGQYRWGKTRKQAMLAREGARHL